MSEKDNKKIKWFDVRQDFLIEHEHSGVSAKDFFVSRNINPNTGRKQFSNVAKLIDDGLSPNEINLKLLGKRAAKNGDLKTSGSPKKVIQKSDPKAGETGSFKTGSPKTDHKTASKAVSNKASRGGAKLPQNKKVIKPLEKSRRLTYLQPELYRDASSDEQIKNCGRFSRGNGAAMKHGGYMSLFNVDSNILDALIENGSDITAVNTVFESRFIMMNLLLESRLNDLKNQHSKGVEFRDANDNVMTLEDMVRQSVWGSMPVMSNVFSVLSNAKIAAARTNAEVEVKKYKLFREQTDRTRIREILQQYSGSDDSELSALDIAREIEREGLKVPPIIMAEALKVIAELKPPVDDTGITNDELDALVNQQAQDINKQAGILTERRFVIEAMMMQAKMEIEKGELTEEQFNQGDFTGVEHLTDLDPDEVLAAELADEMDEWD